MFRSAGNAQAIEPYFGDTFDIVYASLIFTRTRPLAERLRSIYPDVVIGGTGWDLGKDAEDRASLEKLGIPETLKPDYSIYPRYRSSIGFTQRGCRMNCWFCDVPKKEGKVRAVATIHDIWRGEPYPRELLLLDNDFFGQKNWPDLIEAIRTGGFKVCFTQGINARMLNDEAAVALASIDCRDGGFKRKRIYTAWDNIGDEAVLFRGLRALTQNGFKPDEIMVYMLIGAGEDAANREYRREQLRSFGCRPYPMPLERTLETVGFQRWVVGAYDKRISWEDWKAAKYQPVNLDIKSGDSLFTPPLSPSKPRG